MKYSLLKQVLLISLIAFSFALQGQVINIENKRIYDDTTGWNGSIDGSIAMMQTKDLLFNFTFRPKIQFKTKKHSYLLLADMFYSKGSEIYANSGMAHFRYAYRIKGPWKWESYTQTQYNKLLDQRLRALAGTGLRVKFMDNDGYKLFVGTSTFFEYEEIQSSSVVNQDFRSSTYLSWFIDPKTVFTFSGATYFQPRWDNLSDYRIMGQYSLNFKLTQRTDFKFEFTTFYDTRPPLNVRKWIFSSGIGLSVKIGH
jgi:hypothetical protein